MQVSGRLEAVLAACGSGDTAADIGCDHAFVAIELVSRGRFRRALAMDVRPGPLSRAESHIRERGLEGQITTRLSDGLEKLAPGEADTIVIAGMGGPLMTAILEAGEETAKKADRLVLSPQSDLPAFREYLITHGYRIAAEKLLQDEGKTYSILTAVPGEAPEWTPEEYRYGKCLIDRKDPELENLLTKEIRRDRLLLEHLQACGEGERSRSRRAELQRELLVAEEVLSRMAGKGREERNDSNNGKN